jgi:toxin CcdB
MTAIYNKEAKKKATNISINSELLEKAKKYKIMAQFDVYENTNEKTKDYVPYLLDIQNDILKNLSSRVVIPLVVSKEAINLLNPKFVINEIDVILSTTELASIPINILGNKVCSLQDRREEIICAVDFLVTGF